MKNIRNTLLLFFTWAGLSSCHSFNHYEIYGMNDGGPALAPHKASAAAVAIETATLSDEKIHSESATGSHPKSNTESSEINSEVKKPTFTVTCPVYRLPDLGSAPDLPYDKLDKLKKSNDPHDFDQVAENQITMLYQYIGQMKHALRESHQQYLRDCQNYVTSKTDNQNSLGR